MSVIAFPKRCADCLKNAATHLAIGAMDMDRPVERAARIAHAQRHPDPQDFICTACMTEVIEGGINEDVFVPLYPSPQAAS